MRGIVWCQSVSTTGKAHKINFTKLTDFKITWKLRLMPSCMTAINHFFIQFLIICLIILTSFCMHADKICGVILMRGVYYYLKPWYVNIGQHLFACLGKLCLLAELPAPVCGSGQLFMQTANQERLDVWLTDCLLKLGSYIFIYCVFLVTQGIDNYVITAPSRGGSRE